MSKQDVKNILKTNIHTADFYTIASTVHKTHKNKKLKIKNTYLEDIYRDQNRTIKIKKCTQVGVSEWLVIRALIRARNGANVFYVFPTYELKNQFVKERFDKSIMYTRYYTDLLNSADNRMFESLSLKMIGKGSIVFVGSNSQVGFLSFPADDVIIDERNKCNDENIGMAKDRQGHSEDKTNIIVSNPDYEGFGIDIDYEASDQKQWTVECRCGEQISPDFFKHVVRQADDHIWVIRDKDYDPKGGRDIKTICHVCGRAFDRLAAGRWEGTNDHEHSGYQISKLFAGTVSVKEMVERFSTGLKDENEMQHFYNNDLGLSFTASGAKIDGALLDNCIKDYPMPSGSTDVNVAGVDVGNVLNVVIGDTKNRVNYIGEVRDPEDLLMLFKKYNVRMYVIDALPEKRMATKLVRTFRRGFMCYYTQAKKGLTYDLKALTISSDRTVALDAVKEVIVSEKITFPHNAKTIKSFYEQMTSSTRIFNEKRNEYEWVHNLPDHYFHATAYMLLAQKLLVAVKG